MESWMEQGDCLGRSQEQTYLGWIQLVPPAGLNLHSKPAQSVRTVSSALHLVVTPKNAPFSLCQVWGFGCRQSEIPPRDGMVLLCSCAFGNPSELLWEWRLEPWGEFGAMGWVLTVPLFPLLPALMMELGLFHRSQIWSQGQELPQLRLNWASPFPAGSISQDKLSLENSHISVLGQNLCKMAFVPQWCSEQFWACPCPRPRNELPFGINNLSKSCNWYRGQWSSLVLVSWWEGFLFWSAPCAGNVEGEELVLTAPQPTAPIPPHIFISSFRMCFSLSLLSKVLTKSIGLAGEREKNLNQK